MKYPRARIVVFSKAPLPGQVKTRLVPLLGEQGAARCYSELLDSTLARVTRTTLCPVELHCSPDTAHAQFHRLHRQYRVALQPQSGADLGERMSSAFAQTLPDSDAVVLIGADCPALTATDLDCALSALYRGTDVVLGPAQDGGYYLIGLRNHVPDLFAGMPWGSVGLLADTRRRVAALGLSLVLLPVYRDIDSPDDYLAWRNGPGGKGCPDSNGAPDWQSDVL